MADVKVSLTSSQFKKIESLLQKGGTRLDLYFCVCIARYMHLM